MTIPLTPEEEAKLEAIAEDRGVSPDVFIRGVVKEILDRIPLSGGRPVQPEERENQLEELFDTFDSVSMPSGVREEAFHRENWYR